MPRSPISVASPAGSSARSVSSAHAASTRLYRSGSHGDPKTMLSRIDPATIQGTCWQYPTLPLIVGPDGGADDPSAEGGSGRSSPSKAARIELFPEPTWSFNKGIRPFIRRWTYK